MEEYTVYTAHYGDHQDTRYPPMVCRLRHMSHHQLHGWKVLTAAHTREAPGLKTPAEEAGSKAGLETVEELEHVLADMKLVERRNVARKTKQWSFSGCSFERDQERRMV